MGRTQVAGRPNEQFGECFFGRLVILHVQVNDFFALGGIDVGHRLGKLERVRCLEGLLLGVNFVFRGNTSVRKKLLRLATRLSARSVITPVDLRHRYSFL